MLEARNLGDLVSPSTWSAAPKIFSLSTSCRPITPSIGCTADKRSRQVWSARSQMTQSRHWRWPIGLSTLNT